ncbi:MAG: preprotein translocase subunit SecG [Actinobacteria bacterium]|nr:preprotein translocase subunit SecG [Actinomycetota bacterium]
MFDRWYLILLFAIQMIVCIALIVFVLLHSGKGGGLSEAFGGTISSFTSTSIIEKNLNRITIVLSLIFAVVTILLSILL